MYNPDATPPIVVEAQVLSDAFVCETFLLATSALDDSAALTYPPDPLDTWSITPPAAAIPREDLQATGTPALEDEAVADMFYNALLLVYRYTWHRCQNLPYRSPLAHAVAQDVLVAQWGVCLQAGSLDASLRARLLLLTRRQLEQRIAHNSHLLTKPIQSLPSTPLPMDSPHGSGPLFKSNGLQDIRTHEISDFSTPAKKVDHRGRHVP